MELISITGSFKNEEENLNSFYLKVKTLFENQLKDYKYQIILIDNASTDNSVEIVKKICQFDKNVHLIENIKDYGQDKSPYFAIISSNGDYVIPMVTDLQDPFETVVELVEKIKKNKVDIVFAIPKKIKKGSKIAKSLYYKLMQLATNGNHIENFHGFGIYSKKVVDALRAQNDRNPYLRVALSEMNFSSLRIFYNPNDRVKGKSKNNFFSLFDIGIMGFVATSNFFLKLIVLSGILGSLISFLIGSYYLFLKLSNWDEIQLGIAPMIVGFFFFSSVQLFVIGLVCSHLSNKIEKISTKPIVVTKNQTNIK